MYHWELVEAMFKENSPVKQHLDSYNEFVNKKIYEIIQEVNESEAASLSKYTIRFNSIRLEKPVVVEADGSRKPLLPIEARIRDRTYSASIYANISILEEGAEKDKAEVYIGELPVMLKSDLCYLKGLSKEELIEKGEDPNDPGGYFIVSGSERVLVTIEDLAPNRVIVSKDTVSGREVITASLFSVRKGFRAKVSVERRPDGIFYISFPSSPNNINAFIIMRALGLESKNKILNAFSDKLEVINDVLLNLEAIEPKNMDEALDYLGKRVAAGQSEEFRKNRAAYILDNYLLPHVGVKPEDRLKKAHYIARMIERMIEVAYGKREEDDRDHYANKRLRISGVLMEELFRYALGHFIKDLKYQIDRAATRGRKMQVKTLVRPDALTDRIMFAMGTGMWLGGRRTGVSQLLDRLCYMATLSHLRRVNSPLMKTQQHFEARDLHPTHFGKICTHETPEGQRVGLVKNLAIGCVISSHEIEGLEPELEKLGVKMIKD